VVANSDLLTVLPRHLISSTGMTDALIWKELPFPMPDVHIDMLWHERDARNPAQQWLREHLIAMTNETITPELAHDKQLLT
jgi:DNA-binding transcriptional LysR family regulator